MAQRAVILGGQFGGLAVLRGLRHLFGERLDIVAVAAVPEGPYRPDLVFAAAGMPDRAVRSRIDVAAVCRRLSVPLIEDVVVGIDPATQRVHLLRHSPVAYDVLFWATGMDPEPALLPGWSPGQGAVCQDFSAYAAGRQAGPEDLVLVAGPLAQDPAVRPALASPCECPLYEVALLAYHRRRLPPPRRITVITGADRLGQELGPKARTCLQQLLRQAGVTVVTGARFLAWEGNTIWLADRGPITAAAFVVMPPSAGSRLARASGLDDGYGWVPTNGFLQHPLWPNIYALGDLNRGSLPKMGHNALVQAWVAVRHFAYTQGRRNKPPAYRPLMVGAMMTGDGRALATVQDVIYGGRREWTALARPAAWVKTAFASYYRWRPGGLFWLP